MSCRWSTAQAAAAEWLGKSAADRAAWQYEHDRTADHLEHLHDVYLVWPLEKPEHSSAQGDIHQLAHCFDGVLFSVASESDWFLRVNDGAAEDHSGSDNPYGVFRLLGAVTERIAEVELPGGIRDDGGRGFRDFQEMVARNGASRVPVDCHLP
jgi:hypothetical protein